MKTSIAVLVLYTFISIPSFAEIEPMTNVCNEAAFLECTNKSKKQCENAINLTLSYCGKKLELDKTIDWNNLQDSYQSHALCINNSLEAYFDGESEKLYECFSKTDFIKNLEKTEPDIFMQAIKDLRVAPPVYKIVLVIYYIVAILLINLIFKNYLKTINELKLIIYRALTISIILSPTVMVGGEVTALIPALLAIALSSYYSGLSVFVYAIIIPMVSIFFVIVIFLYLSSLRKMKKSNK